MIKKDLNSKGWGYESPAIITVEVLTEAGFATSWGTGELSDDPANTNSYDFSDL